MGVFRTLSNIEDFSEDILLHKCGLHDVKSVQIRSFFWSLFFHIQSEYGEILCISPYSVRVRENTDQKTLRIWTLFTQCYVLCLKLEL